MTAFRRGSALVVAIWVIATLAVMVLSFATEAHLQTGINVYMRERNRVNRLVDAGQVLGEVVLAGYDDAKEWSADESSDDLMEEDRWYAEKRALKYDAKCTIGPILVDEDNVDAGTVTVEIELANAGEKHAINVNELYQTSDQNYRTRWEMILQSHGVPEEIESEEDGTIQLWSTLIASWNDWRDEDDTATAIDGEECGAEAKWYEEQYDEDDVEDEHRRFPRNNSIPDVQELAYVRGFRDYPAVLTGGVLNPWAEKEEQVSCSGIVDLLGTTGSAKVNVNNCTVEQLLTVPGIFDEEDEEDMSSGRELAQAIIEGLKEMPDYDVDETRSWWPYKDWNDLCNRLQDVEIGSEASNYLMYGADSSSVFKMKITGESMGVRHTVSAECYVKEKKVRYIKWRED